jgi:peroxiredoxin family protein
VGGDEVSVFLSMNALSYFIKDRTAAAPAEGEFGRIMAGKNVPPFKELFQKATEFGDARIHPCSMAMDVLGAQPGDLEPYLGPPIGLTKFMIDTEGGRLMTF